MKSFLNKWKPNLVIFIDSEIWPNLIFEIKKRKTPIALINGRKAMGIDQKLFFEVGKPLDALVISDQHPLIQTSSLKNLSNTMVYSSDLSMYKGTIVNGDWKIKKSFC